MGGPNTGTADVTPPSSEVGGMAGPRGTAQRAWRKDWQGLHREAEGVGNAQA